MNSSTPDTAAAVVGAVFAALYAAHQIGDHWVQTHHQALTKSSRGWAGRWADTKHVATLTITKLVAIGALCAATGLRVSLWACAGALCVDALSHWWADRRSTLLWLAQRLEHAGINGKTQFHALGAPRPGHRLKGTTIGSKPLTVLADDNPTLGTGAYALDQSWHIAWLFITALIIAAT